MLSGFFAALNGTQQPDGLLEHVKKAEAQLATLRAKRLVEEMEVSDVELPGTIEIGDTVFCTNSDLEMLRMLSHHFACIRNLAFEFMAQWVRHGDQGSLTRLAASAGGSTSIFQKLEGAIKFPVPCGGPPDDATVHACVFHFLCDGSVRSEIDFDCQKMDDSCQELSDRTKLEQQRDVAADISMLFRAFLHAEEMQSQRVKQFQREQRSIQETANASASMTLLMARTPIRKDSLLHVAIRMGDVALAEDVLQADITMVQATSDGSNVVNFSGTQLLDGFFARNADNLYPLHLAAALGSEDMCKLLLRFGARPYMKSGFFFRGTSAVDLAQEHGHHRIVDLLVSRSNLSTVRGGTGDAFEKAMQDPRTVTAIRWFHIPLPGIAGRIGAYHSLLQVTVGRQLDSHIYVIEKAAISRTQDIEATKHGVHISNWDDVAPNVQNDALHELIGVDVQSNTDGEFNMRTLREIAVGQHSYDVVHSNCHHAAMDVFNACAVAARQVHIVPNGRHVKAASLLRSAGFDVARARSQSAGLVTIESTSVSPAPYANEFHRFPMSDTGGAHDRNLALQCAILSSWIYEPTTTPSCSFRNATDQTLLLMFSDFPRLTKRVLPGESAAVAELGAQNMFELWVYRESLGSKWTGLVSPRIRLLQIQLSACCNYVIRNADHAVLCEPVVRSPQLPVTMDMVHLELANETQLVQWAAVVDGDTLFVVFKGTDNLTEVLIDIGALAVQHPLHGLHVHSLMHASLQPRPTRDAMDSNGVIARVSAQAQRMMHQGVKNIVLCGHSLGGGYAILTALEMVHANPGSVTAVVTMGAPQVVVPPRQANATWNRVNDLTSLYVHNWDPVPRLPSAWDWLKGGLEIAPLTVSVLNSTLKSAVGFSAEGLQRHLSSLKEELKTYDIVGKLHFVSRGVKFVMIVPHVADRSHRVHLESTPDEWGVWVVKQHQCGHYIPALADLALQAHES